MSQGKSKAMPMQFFFFGGGGGGHRNGVLWYCASSEYMDLTLDIYIL